MKTGFQISPTASLQSAVDRLIALYQRGEFASVIAQSEALIERHPGIAMLHNILGAASIGMADHGRAAAAYERAAALDPNDAEIHNNRGIALGGLDRVEEAALCYRRALELKPDYAEAHYNLGNALRKQRASDEAVAAYGRALALRPGYADALNNLGLALRDLHRLDEALSCYRQALAIQPNSADALSNLGSLLMEGRDFDGAIRALQLALALRPDKSDARAQMLYARTQVCDFTVFAEHDAMTEAELVPGLVPPFTMLVFADDPARQLAYSRAWQRTAETAMPAPIAAGPKATGERIRIGYFSADFHGHATLCLMAGLFREHDRERFEVTAYSYGPPREDEARAELVGNVDRFCDIREMPDSDVVELARGHGLDIAVDLKGYTQHSRSRLFAQRLAPVQVNYIGYPGSMGGRFIDYLIADDVVIPSTERQFYTEKIVSLFGSYQPNDDRRAIIDSDTTRIGQGLPVDGFVFCCFNQNYKISPREFDIWMRLLGKVEGSVLWLLRSNEWAEANLRREAGSRGIDPDRLIFAPNMPHNEHLGRLKHADLFLDTFNVNAHTTASDALWAGLPVLTRTGRQFAARVCASLVHAVGLPELVTESDAAYEARALEMAANPARLAELRMRLAANRLTYPLFDTVGYARRLEAAYLAMHQRAIDGLPPEDMAIR